MIDATTAKKIKGIGDYHWSKDNDLYIVDLGDTEAIAYVTEYTQGDGSTFELFDEYGWPLDNWRLLNSVDYVTTMVDDEVEKTLRHKAAMECVG